MTKSPPLGPAFLLAQIGAHASARFADLLAPMGLSPAHAGLMRMIAVCSGGSQQEVAGRLKMFPSRLVALIDELQERGLVERAPNPGDRRTHALRLTPEGQRTLDTIADIGCAHQDALLAALTPAERDKLSSLLQKVVSEQGLTPGVHPAFARMRPPSAAPDE